MTNWKVKKEKSTYKSELFEIKQTTFQNPQGEIKTHDNIYRRPSVFIFPIASNGDIYLISEYRFFFQKQILDACAGFIEEKETPLETAKRELRETEEIKIVKIPLKDAIQKIYSGEIFVAPTVAGILMLAGLKLNSH